MQERPRFDRRLLVAVVAIPLMLIAATGIRGVIGGSPPAAPSPTTAVPAPTQLPGIHTPLPVRFVPTPRVTLTPPIPPAREMTATAYDSMRNDVVMFGGGGFGPGIAPPPGDDTWTFDSSGWHEQHPPTSPPALSDLLMTEDPNTRDLILVGQSSLDSTSATVETWLWDGRTWARMADLPVREPPVSMATLISSREVVLVTYAEPAAGAPPTGTHTWTWDGSTWSLRHPDANLPVGGASPTLIGNPARRRVIALTATTADNGQQTWSWDGDTWLPVAAPGQPHYDPITASGAEDPYSGDVVLYMGGGDSGGTTWILGADGWHLADPTSPAVDTDYHGAQLVADPHLRAVIVIGGAGRPNPLNVLWTFTGAHWIALEPTALGAPRG